MAQVMESDTAETGFVERPVEFLDEPSRLEWIAVAVWKNQIVLHPF